MPLAADITSGSMPGPLVRPELAGAAHAGLHLVQRQQQAELVAAAAQVAQEVAARPGARRPRPGTGST
jgi:hypothetical protein